MIPCFPSSFREHGYWPESEAAQHVTAISDTCGPHLVLDPRAKQNLSLKNLLADCQEANTKLREQVSKATRQIQNLKETTSDQAREITRLERLLRDVQAANTVPIAPTPRACFFCGRVPDFKTDRHVSSAHDVQCGCRKEAQMHYRQFTYMEAVEHWNLEGYRQMPPPACRPVSPVRP